MANPYLDPFDKELLPKIKEITADKVVTITEFLEVSGIAIGVAENLMSQWTVFNATDKMHLLDAAAILYDRYVMPIDIKRVPNWIERPLKPWLRAQMLEALGEFIDQYIQANFVGGQRSTATA